MMRTHNHTFMLIFCRTIYFPTVSIHEARTSLACGRESLKYHKLGWASGLLAPRPLRILRRAEGHTRRRCSCSNSSSHGGWEEQEDLQGEEGRKKKTVDPFAKKDWYDIKAPSVFSVRNIGNTLVSRTQGTKIASEGLKHRVFEVCLADLQNDEDQAHRKIRLRAEDVQGKNVLTNFWILGPKVADFD
ncbi:hypothetical protein OPV22_010518 [Ensete ventricosum]|uniref:40S ribosomal protein S3a n=1 Tax=Ensete ventricosum TaxID=4639 RepID=A0AAV8RBH2_ENSVE|nr:hypothetical protein OPV22_010518 [Ensete ventricosum]